MPEVFLDACINWADNRSRTYKILTLASIDEHTTFHTHLVLNLTFNGLSIIDIVLGWLIFRKVNELVAPYEELRGL
jgi:hypothetical protein